MNVQAAIKALNGGSVLAELAQRPHLPVRVNGELILKPLLVVPVADRVGGLPSRFVSISPRSRS